MPLIWLRKGRLLGIYLNSTSGKDEMEFFLSSVPTKDTKLISEESLQMSGVLFSLFTGLASLLSDLLCYLAGINSGLKSKYFKYSISVICYVHLVCYLPSKGLYLDDGRLLFLLARVIKYLYFL